DVLAQVDVGTAERLRRGGLGAVQLAVDVDLAGAVAQALCHDQVPGAVVDRPAGSEVEAVLAASEAPPVHLAAGHRQDVLAGEVAGVALLDDYSVAAGFDPGRDGER